MKTVKFLGTSAGVYGIAHAGDELTLKDSIANQLEKQGTVKITGDADDDAEESVAEKGSFRISDQTSKEKAERIEETDPLDPTNEAKNKEKNSKAGPNAAKKKK